jgi:hypothetical protein
MNQIAALIRPRAMLLVQRVLRVDQRARRLRGGAADRQCAAAAAPSKVFYVTHLYDFSHGVYSTHRDDALFLRAERLPNGTRPVQAG